MKMYASNILVLYCCSRSEGNAQLPALIWAFRANTIPGELRKQLWDILVQMPFPKELDK